MRKISLLIIILLTFSISVSAQSFGKNKVQYKNFEWFYLQSQHFDVYYYPGGRELASFAADVAEHAYLQLKRDFSFEIQERIVLIVYKSHNDWQQTNVVLTYLQEGIGGVTELYKNRVVVPFEGSYEQFRHVIHHELVHAVMNDMIYKGSIQSLLMGEVMPLPLWVSEGMAEFESTGWGTRTDMIVRDAMLTGYMPPVQYLQYVLAYQGGNSVFRYIAETYGREKIGEILNKSRGKNTFENILKNTIGLDYETLTENWHRYLRKIYWTEVSDRMVPKDFSKQLTNHVKKKNYINVSPAISPQGDKIAYISDRTGQQNIYLISAIDGKEIKTLVKGERSESFEELHWLRPGMSFSPDGKKIALAAKSGEWDAIYVIDVENGKTDKYTMNMDGAFTVSWSPDGQRIAFVGNKDNQSDIYIYNIRDGILSAVTNDVFTDDQPSWSPDGRYIAFVSDRGDYLSDADLPADFKMSKYDYEFRDIYTVEVTTGNIKRWTNTPWEESTPIFTPDGNQMAFTSDENGIFNIYMKDLNTGEYSAVTDLISGAFQINWDKKANKLVYTSFYKGGFDIYLINNPLDLEAKKLRVTQFVEDMRQNEPPVYARNWEPKEDDESKKITEKGKDGRIEGEISSSEDYSRYTFGRYNLKKKKTERKVQIPDDKLRDDEGQYKSKKYKIKFSPDLVTGAAGYNTFFGVQGYTSLAFSDLLGDHKIYLNTNLWADLRNSDFALNYLNLKDRINWGVGGYHIVYLLQDGYNGLLRYRNYGGVVSASYPFSKFSRLDFGVNWYNVNLEYLDSNFETEKVGTVMPQVGYTHDNVLWGLRWGILAPVKGSRYYFGFKFSPKYNDTSREFHSFNMDYRKYFMLSTKYQFAFRGSAGASFGKNSQQYFLGGMDNWINRRFRGGRRIDRIDDVFFSEFKTPLRGAYYYDRIGDRYFMANMEFRFPLIEYLQLGFPPISLFNIRGVAFYDIGSAWYQDSGSWYSLSDFKGVSRDANGNKVFDDLISGYGIGARVYFLGFLIRWDMAWPFDLNRSKKPIHYWSLGLDF